MQKRKTPRSKKYLKFIRNQNPLVFTLGGDVVAHHVRINNGGGTGLKPSDYRTLPICSIDHQELHQMGEKSYWSSKDIDYDKEVIRLMLKYCIKHGDLKNLMVVIEDYIVSDIDM